MTLPMWLLEAVCRAVADDAEAERIAREWQRRIPEMQATAARIRAQTAGRAR